MSGVTETYELRHYIASGGKIGSSSNHGGGNATAYGSNSANCKNGGSNYTLDAKAMQALDENAEIMRNFYAKQEKGNKRGGGGEDGTGSVRGRGGGGGSGINSSYMAKVATSLSSAGIITLRCSFLLVILNDIVLHADIMRDLFSG